MAYTCQSLARSHLSMCTLCTSISCTFDVGKRRMVVDDDVDDSMTVRLYLYLKFVWFSFGLVFIFSFPFLRYFLLICASASRVGKLYSVLTSNRMQYIHNNRSHFLCKTHSLYWIRINVTTTNLISVCVCICDEVKMVVRNTIHVNKSSKCTATVYHVVNS